MSGSQTESSPGKMPRLKARKLLVYQCADIAIKPDWSPVFPILIVVGFNTRSTTKTAEEKALGRVDHDPYMSLPNHQVAWLRPFYSLKTIGSPKQIGRAGVGIGESCPVVYGVDKM